ncbi:uncharacterized protein [Phaseolus vulgaris]|uniref:uncharacterized protein n=1 Tax=Phaseolus vulgaris TaxID=3885 RepID=UPI0035CC4B84
MAPNQVSCNDFLDWINTNDLACMTFTGSGYTLCNGRRGLHRIHRRLDRALCNGVCLDEWDSCSYQVLVRNCSYHSPILASLASNSLKKVSNFCIFSMWLQDSSCLKLIHDSWNNKVVGCPMFILQHKLKRLKTELCDWNKNSFGNVHNAVILKQGLLLSIQQNLEIASMSDIDGLLCQEKKTKEEFDHALHCQYLFWKERAKMLWFKDGDRHTAFFHVVVKRRNNSSEIHRLRIYNVENMMLMKSPYFLEIKNVIFNLNGNSASGPDGFAGVFYQSCWDIIGTDVFLRSKERFFTLLGPDEPIVPPQALEVGVTLVPPTDTNLDRAAICPVNCCTSFTEIRLLIARIVAHFSGFAFIPRSVSRKPKNLPASTPNTHFSGFSFSLYLAIVVNSSSRSATC